MPSIDQNFVDDDQSAVAVLSFEQRVVKNTLPAVTAVPSIDQNLVEDAQPEVAVLSFGQRAVKNTLPAFTAMPSIDQNFVDDDQSAVAVLSFEQRVVKNTLPAVTAVPSIDQQSIEEAQLAVLSIDQQFIEDAQLAVLPTELRSVKSAPSENQPDAVHITEVLESPALSDADAAQPTYISDDIDHVTRAEVSSVSSDPVHIVDPSKPSNDIHVPRVIGPDSALEAHVVYAYTRRLVEAWCPKDAPATHNETLEQWVRMGLYDDQHRAVSAQLASYHKRSNSVIASAYNGAPRDCDGNIQDLEGILERAQGTVEYLTIPVAYTIHRRLVEATRIESMIAEAYRKAPRNSFGNVDHLADVIVSAATKDLWSHAPRDRMDNLLDIKGFTARFLGLLRAMPERHIKSTNDSTEVAAAAPPMADPRMVTAVLSHQAPRLQDSLSPLAVLLTALPEAPSSDPVIHGVHQELGVTGSARGEQPLEAMVQARIDASHDVYIGKGGQGGGPERLIVTRAAGHVDASRASHERDGKSHNGSPLAPSQAGYLYAMPAQRPIDDAKFSTEAELVGMSDLSSKVIGLRNTAIARQVHPTNQAIFVTPNTAPTATAVAVQQGSSPPMYQGTRVEVPTPERHHPLQRAADSPASFQSVTTPASIDNAQGDSLWRGDNSLITSNKGVLCTLGRVQRAQAEAATESPCYSTQATCGVPATVTVRLEKGVRALDDVDTGQNARAAQSLPHDLALQLALAAVSSLDCRLTAAPAGDRSPHQIWFASEHIHVQDYQYAFGDPAMASTPNQKNDIAPRADTVMVLHPVFNGLHGYPVYKLGTGMLVVRNHNTLQELAWGRADKAHIERLGDDDPDGKDMPRREAPTATAAQQAPPAAQSSSEAVRVAASADPVQRTPHRDDNDGRIGVPTRHAAPDDIAMDISPPPPDTAARQFHSSEPSAEAGGLGVHDHVQPSLPSPSAMSSRRVSSVFSMSTSLAPPPQQRSSEPPMVTIKISAKQGLREQPAETLSAITHELRQMLRLEVFKPIDYRALNPDQRSKVIYSSMLLKHKYIPQGVFVKCKA